MSAFRSVLRRLFLHRAGLMALAFLLCQQLIVASSSWWLVEVFREEAGSRAFTIALVLYVLSLFLPHLPATSMFIYLEQWHQECLRRFVAFSVEHLENAPLLWGDAEQRQKKTALISAEGQRVIGDFVKYAYGLAASGLNTLLNLLVVGVVIENKLLLSYGVGLLGSTLLLKHCSARNAQLANEAQDSRVALGAQLLRIWDNVVLGNTHNHQVWRGRVETRLDQSRDRSVKSQRFNELIALGVALFTILPSILVVIASVVWGKGDAAYSVALVAILPRLFQILNTSHDLLSNVADWHVYRGRLQSIMELEPRMSLLSETARSELTARVRFADILASGEDGTHPISSTQELLARLPRAPAHPLGAQRERQIHVAPAAQGAIGDSGGVPPSAEHAGVQAGHRQPVHGTTAAGKH